MIVATEPLWASLFGLLLLGESLDQRSVVGGALVVAACVVSSLEPSTVRAVLPFGVPSVAGEPSSSFPPSLC